MEKDKGEILDTPEAEKPREDGGPAFPQNAPLVPQGHYDSGPGASPGMSLRDYFAAFALQGLVADAWMKCDELSANGLCRDAWRFADAMLAERSA